MKNFSKIFFITIWALISCRGTDVLDDPIVEPKFTVTQTQVALRIGESADLSAKYFDEYGVEKQVNFTWVSTQNQIVNLNATGKITGASAGTTQVYPQYQTTRGNAVNVTVVANDNSIARVNITSGKTSLALNESINLSVVAQNINNQTVNGGTVEWVSENQAIVNVNASGQVTAVANGAAGVFARVNDVKSNVIEFTVGNSQLSGTFTSTGG